MKAKNQFFEFKQFKIWQDKTALKVCTESCILGAYSAQYLSELTKNQILNILDIGTGTGLLAMMIAQKMDKSKIVAVEIDKNAFEQAKTNVEKSIFQTQIEVSNSDINVYESNHKFDFIISNPPFFQNYLKSNVRARNMALHDESLSLNDLAHAVQNLLTETGTFILILPQYEMSQFELLANEKSMFKIKSVQIHNSPKKPIFREIAFFKKNEQNSLPKTEIFYISNDINEYSPEFKMLLKEYYLHL